MEMVRFCVALFNIFFALCTLEGERVVGDRAPKSMRIGAKKLHLINLPVWKLALVEYSAVLLPGDGTIVAMRGEIGFQAFLAINEKTDVVVVFVGLVKLLTS